jgi:hypothetical protein
VCQNLCTSEVDRIILAFTVRKPKMQKKLLKIVTMRVELMTLALLVPRWRLVSGVALSAGL